MDDTRWERTALLGGPVFVLLQLVGGFLPGPPPSPDASADEIVAYFHDNAGALSLGSWLIVLGGLFIVFWAASLWRAMVRAEAGRPRLALVAVLGLVLAGAMAQVSTAIYAALALRVDDLAPDTAHFAFTLSGTAASMLYVGEAAMVAAVSLLVWRTDFLPRWMTWVGGVAFVASLPASAGVASDAEIWVYFALPAFLLWAVWIVLISVQLRSTTPSATDTA